MVREAGSTSFACCDHKLTAQALELLTFDTLVVHHNTTTHPTLVELAHETLLSHGLYSARQAAKTEGVQVLWRRSQSSLAICPQALLHPCGDPLFSHVDGVSQTETLNLSLTDFCCLL